MIYVSDTLNLVVLDSKNIVPYCLHNFKLNFQRRNEDAVFMRTTKLETTAERIKYFRLLKNMKQSEVCEYIGVSRNTYLSYENPDRTSYSEVTLKKLTECFGISIEMLK